MSTNDYRTGTTFEVSGLDWATYMNLSRFLTFGRTTECLGRFGALATEATDRADRVFIDPARYGDRSAEEVAAWLRAHQVAHDITLTKTWTPPSTGLPAWAPVEGPADEVRPLPLRPTVGGQLTAMMSVGELKAICARLEDTDLVALPSTGTDYVHVGGYNLPGDDGFDSLTLHEGAVFDSRDTALYVPVSQGA